jgi:Bacterial regulatory proteins, gntR family
LSTPLADTRGACALTVAHLAALAGVSETTVRNALREAEALKLIGIDRRRRTPWINYPNAIRILSKEWAMWLRLRTGANSRTPRVPEDKSGQLPAASVLKLRTVGTLEQPPRAFGRAEGDRTGDMKRDSDKRV